MWTPALRSYITMMRAAGRSENTIRLHRHYLSTLANLHDDPWAVTAADLHTILARPTWGAECRKSARSVYRGFYGWAAALGLSTNPAADLPAVRVNAGTPRPTPEAIFHAVASSADRRVAFMALLAGCLGMRAGEIARLHADDYDQAARRLVIHGKGDKERVLPVVDDQVAARLDELTGWAFGGKTDGHMSPGHVSRLLSRSMPDGWTAHTLRHRAGTRAYLGTHDVLAVSRMLGHSRTETTLRYVQMDDEALVAAMNAAAA